MSKAYSSPAAKGRPAPIQYQRGSSTYDNKDSNTVQSSAEDPRSPGVPRTPGGKPDPAPTKTPTKASGRPSTTPTGANPPESPLASFITQTDATGTPIGRPSPQPPGSPLATVGPDGNGSLAGALCCCLQPNAQSRGKDSGGSSGGSGGAKASESGDGGATQLAPRGQGGGSEVASPTGARRTSAKKSNGASPTFGTFHYEDPAHPSGQPILPPVEARDKGKLCLVLDLDETLVHSSFRAVPNPDYIIPVQIEDTVHHVYVCKRPGVDEYLRRCGERYEVIIYTASLNKYADPLLDKLDVGKVIRHRLFRESCTQYQGNYVKNLSLLGRDLQRCVIVDNSPLSYLFHPENAVGCISWIDQQDDEELGVIQDFCEVVESEDDVRLHMRHWRQGKAYDPAAAYN